MSDDSLREAYRRALARRAPVERAACPTPEAILALVRREGDEERRLAVLDHAMSCPACRDEFELLRAIERAGGLAAHAEAGAPALRAERTGTPGRVVGHIAWRRWVPLAAAAVVALVLALGPGRGLWQSGGESMRGGGEPLALIAPADAAMPSGRVTFVWRSSPDAERYTLEVLTGGGDVALSRMTSDTTLTLVAAGLLSPGNYRWWVVARAGDGSETRSGTRTLRLRAR